MFVKVEKDTYSPSLAALFNIMFFADRSQRVQQRVPAHYAPNFLPCVHLLFVPALDSTLALNILPHVHDRSI